MKQYRHVRKNRVEEFKKKGWKEIEFKHDDLSENMEKRCKERGDLVLMEKE